jgi:hypothetical protein
MMRFADGERFLLPGGMAGAAFAFAPFIAS